MFGREPTAESKKAPGKCKECGTPRMKTAFIDEGGATRAGGVCQECGLVWILDGFLPNSWTAEDRTADGTIVLSGMKTSDQLLGFQILPYELMIKSWERNNGKPVRHSKPKACQRGHHPSSFLDCAMFTSANRCNACEEWLEPKGQLVELERSLRSQRPRLTEEAIFQALGERAQELGLELDGVLAVKSYPRS